MALLPLRLLVEDHERLFPSWRAERGTAVSWHANVASTTEHPPSCGWRSGQLFHLGFESYVAGRHATFMGFVEVAANLFHVGVELILKAELLKPASVTMENCLDQLMSRLGTRYDPDSDRLDPNVDDACRQPYNARAKELQDKYVHSLPRLWTAQGDLG